MSEWKDESDGELDPSERQNVRWLMGKMTTDAVEIFLDAVTIVQALRILGRIWKWLAAIIIAAGVAGYYMATGGLPW